MADSGCILKVEPGGFADRLDVGMRESGISKTLRFLAQATAGMELPFAEMEHTVQGGGIFFFLFWRGVNEKFIYSYVKFKRLDRCLTGDVQ